MSLSNKKFPHTIGLAWPECPHPADAPVVLILPGLCGSVRGSVRDSVRVSVRVSSSVNVRAIVNGDTSPV